MHPVASSEAEGVAPPAHPSGPESQEQLEERLRSETAKVLEDELRWLGWPDPGAQPGRPQQGLSALCLSGGGIRSATFCLGVLQALAQKKMLGRFHYLSTVSGGGYIGSWLSAWMKREGQQKVLDQLAGSQGGQEPGPVRRLRAYTNYLSPVWGLSGDALSLVATFVRNLALNWMVLLPLLAAAVMLPRLQLAMINVSASDPLHVLKDRLPVSLGLLAVAALLVMVSIAYMVADFPPQAAPGKRPKNRFAACCFAPLLAGTVILSWLLAWHAPRFSAHPGWMAAAGAALQVGAIVPGLAWRRWRGLAGARASVLDVVLSAVSGAAAGWLLYWFATWQPLSTFGAAAYATLSVPALLIVFWAGCTVYTAATSRHKTEDDREWWARASAWWLGAGLAWIAAFVVVVHVPQWVLSWPALHMSGGPVAAGAGAALLGIVTSAIGYWSKNGAKIRKGAESFIAATGVKLLDLLAGAFVVMLLAALSIAVSCSLRFASADLGKAATAAQQEAAWLQKAGWPPAPKAGAPAVTTVSAPLAARAHVAYSLVLEQAPATLVALAVALLLLAGRAASWFIGVNTFSLHNMYGNRLARAYLGASNGRREPHWFTGFDAKDNPPLAECAQRPDGARLFHVVNTALNIVRPAGGRLEWQQRMAASFTMTPLHCGSPVLGFVETRLYGAKDGGLSLGRAMAISGAAASPSMGYHTSRLVAFVMTFFNVRLGWWTPNTMRKYAKKWDRREPQFGVSALLNEALARTATERGFVYLSDGGHFENLGLYEMVRRGCTRILVVDASADPKDEFGDLESAIRQVRVDFGAVIRFDEPLPSAQNAAMRKRHVAAGTITYSDGTVGQIAYLKPVVTGHADEPFDVTRFAAANCRKGRAFPHQPTSDQFFDESQFESYRMLGKHAVECSFQGDGDDAWTHWPKAAASTESGLAIRTVTSEQEVAAAKTLLAALRGAAGDKPPAA